MKQQPLDNDTCFVKLTQHNYSGILLLDAAFRVAYSSPAASQILGWGTAAPMGQQIMHLVHPDDVPALNQLLQRVLQTPGLSLNSTFRVKHARKGYIRVENVYTNMLDDPDILAIVCNFRDVPAQKISGLQLQQPGEQRENEELKKKLLTDISMLFNTNNTLQQSLERVLELLIDFGEFILAEAWLISADKKKIKLTAKCCKTVEAVIFFNESAHIKSFTFGEGLPGVTWEMQTIQFWYDIDKRLQFMRRAAAKLAGRHPVV